MVISLSIGALLGLVQIFTLQSLNAAKLRFETDNCALAKMERIRTMSENLGYVGWLFQSSNLHSPLANTLNTGDVFTHGWAVEWQFIQIANLWKPLQPMSFVRNEVSATFTGGAILGIC